MISSRSLDLFRKAAHELPAYGAFLKSKNFDPKTVKSIKDFKTVPVTGKKSYLQNSTRDKLIWKNNQIAPLWFCSTSGSTGEPYYFPRTDDIAARGAQFVEDFLKYSSYGQGRTLVILGFGMGVWIGGVITLRSFEIAASKMKAPVAFLPTGYNKKEVFKALRQLSPDFDQTILVGYPPFIKEVIDEAEDEGLSLKDLSLRLIFAAESFTETFRTYVCNESGIGNPLLDTLNIYGSADMGAMAYETPLSILIRRLALNDKALYKDIFGQIEKTPTLAQYNPNFIDFEVQDGELLLTSDGAIPFIRYAIGDHGGVLSYKRIESLLKKHGIELDTEIHKAHIELFVSKRPFVFVYERTDLSASLQGIIIYPEFIKEGLLKQELLPYFTQRFMMATKNDVHHNQFLEINLELQKGVIASDAIKSQALKVISKTLIDKSSEFAEVSRIRPSEQLIRIILWRKAHEKYFAEGTKQKWVKQA